jgi:F-type H+-transporting ATPase subunit beta
VGKTMVLTEFIHNAVEHFKGVAVFAGIGERSREGLELWDEMRRRGVLERTALIVGHMKETPGARFLVGEAALSIAEYFRDDLGQEVMFVADNLYRHVHASLVHRDESSWSGSQAWPCHSGSTGVLAMWFV